MSFFENVGPPDRNAEEEEYVQPEWRGPPGESVGGVVRVEQVVGRSEKAAIYLTSLIAYPIGFELTTEVVTKPGVDFLAFEMMHPRAHRSSNGEPDPELLRIGISFSDDRKATNLAFKRDATDPDPQRDLLLMPGGGGSGGHYSHQDYWVWPLPPPGPVTFVCEWPALEIAESAIELDGELIRTAAERARSVWDD
jgi:hypothetical protein